MSPPDPDRLEIEQNDTFQRRDWRAQRVGWGALALIAILALAGVFGDGPASTRVTSAPGGGLEVRYQRYVRHNAPSQIELRIAPARVDGAGRVRVWVDREYAAALGFGSVRPAPIETAVTGDLLVYTFAAVAGDRPVTVTFDISPERIGDRSGHVGLLPATGTAIRQFIYP